jgi:hypothetical protein
MLSPEARPNLVSQQRPPEVFGMKAAYDEWRHIALADTFEQQWSVNNSSGGPA